MLAKYSPQGDGHGDVGGEEQFGVLAAVRQPASPQPSPQPRPSTSLGEETFSATLRSSEQFEEFDLDLNEEGEN